MLLLERLLLEGGQSREGMHASLRRIMPFAAASLLVGVIGLASTPARTLNFLTVDLSTAQKLLLPFHTIVSPLGTLFWPAHLGPIYDYPEGLLVMLLSLVIVLLITAASIVLARMRFPGVALSWSIYVVMSIPTALFFLTGIQPLADRYTYLSMMSINLLAGVGLMQLVQLTSAPLRRALFPAVIAAAAVGLGTLAQNQVMVWRTSLSLWSHAVRVAPSSPVVVQQPRPGSS